MGSKPESGFDMVVKGKEPADDQRHFNSFLTHNHALRSQINFFTKHLLFISQWHLSKWRE